MKTEATTADTVSALIYDPVLDEILLMLRSNAVSNDGACWSHFEGAIHAGEHPIIALRREMLEELSLPLAENQYYYLQTLLTADRHERTQYVVLHRKGAQELVHANRATLRWVARHDAMSLLPQTSDVHAALSQFASRFGSEADRLNLAHMLKLTARSS